MITITGGRVYVPFTTKDIPCLKCVLIGVPFASDMKPAATSTVALLHNECDNAVIVPDAEA
jgi:hypothetical protein